MTESTKKFLELASSNEALASKLKNARKDDIIAIAKEHGIELTDADFEQGAEISDDELNAVAGGLACYCFMGGGGTPEKDEKTCVCIAGGGGERKDGKMRCVCPLCGSGGSSDVAGTGR